MEQIYRSIGHFVFWGSIVSLTFYIMGQILIFTINQLGKRMRFLWIIVEFIYYYEEFKEFIKDKERHPKAK